MQKEKRKALNPQQKKSIWTFFTLLFPSLLLTMLVNFPRSIVSSVMGILLFFYQAILLKDFVEKHYNPQA